MKKMDTKQWLETETKKVISDTKKYNRDSRYKRELDQAVLKKVLLMIPLVLIILGANMDHEIFEGLFGAKTRNHVKVDSDTASLFPKIWICPAPSCGYSNYDGISSCALCGTPRS
jgi:hypothetical protein